MTDKQNIGINRAELNVSQNKNPSMNNEFIARVVEKYQLPDGCILAVRELFNPSVYYPFVQRGFIGKVVKIGAGCREELLGLMVILPDIFTVCL